jgi:hypothetical protein
MFNPAVAENNLVRFELNDGHYCEVCVKKMDNAFIGGVIVGHKCCLLTVDLDAFEPAPSLKKINELEELERLGNSL